MGDGQPGAGWPLLLVHGTGSDHTTWRVLGPLLARRHGVYALDRRGRGASSDGPRWHAGREVDDLVVMADEIARVDGRPPALVGHSLGGRLALAAAASGATTVRAVAAIEAAPMIAGDPARAEQEALLADLRQDIVRGDPDAALARFLLVGAGLPHDELAAFRVTPLWHDRVRTLPTVIRELDAALHDPALGRDALAPVAVPVLQLVGTTSPRWFRDAAAALDRQLPTGRLEQVEGAGHGMHHSHPRALAAAVERLLSE